MFNQARIKLTGWYLLIIMLVSISFSVVIYELLSQEVERFARMQQNRIERRFRQNMLYFDLDPQIPISPIGPDLDLIHESKQRIIIILGVVNGAIFFAAGMLGYVLAGKTLYPIQVMVDEQNRFISDASHELKTPITSLKSAMEVSLRNKKFSLNDAKELIKENIDETNRLQQLVEDLLQFTQYQRTADYGFETVSIRAVIEEAIKIVKPLARKKNIQIRVEGKTGEASIYRKGIVNVLVILLDNAVKYGYKGSEISIHTVESEKNIEVEVKDQGIGIEKKDMPHIFDRFYRADAARVKTSTKGFGLGLSIAKRIVYFHNGEIKVSSIAGKGSSFKVCLPKHQKNDLS